MTVPERRGSRTAVSAFYKNTFLDFPGEEASNEAEALSGSKAALFRSKSDPCLRDDYVDHISTVLLDSDQKDSDESGKDFVGTPLPFSSPKKNVAPKQLQPPKAYDPYQRRSKSISVYIDIQATDSNFEICRKLADATQQQQGPQLSTRVSIPAPQSFTSRGLHCLPSTHPAGTSKPTPQPLEPVSDASEADGAESVSKDGSMSAHDATEVRTTVMLRNIPNKYTQKILLRSLDEKGFEGKYDFFYLPIDFRNRCNLGYAFINFTTPYNALRFMSVFSGYALPAFKSTKVCEVCWARVQTLEANIEHYRNSPVNDLPNADLKPLIFVDGVSQEFPKPDMKLRGSHPNTAAGINTSPVGPGKWDTQSQPMQRSLKKLMAQTQAAIKSAASANVGVATPLSALRAPTPILSGPEASTSLHHAQKDNEKAAKKRRQLQTNKNVYSKGEGGGPVKRNKLFVGGLSVSTSTETLQTYFSQFGQITEAAVITDKKTGQSRGFGFCSFSTEVPEHVLTMEHWIDGRSVGVRVYASGGVVPASTTSTNPSAILHQQQQRTQQIQALSAAIQAQKAVAMSGGLAPGVRMSQSLLGVLGALDSQALQQPQSALAALVAGGPPTNTVVHPLVKANALVETPHISDTVTDTPGVTGGPPSNPATSAAALSTAMQLQIQQQLALQQQLSLQMASNPPQGQQATVTQSQNPMAMAAAAAAMQNLLAGYQPSIPFAQGAGCMSPPGVVPLVSVVPAMPMDAQGVALSQQNLQALLAQQHAAVPPRELQGQSPPELGAISAPPLWQQPPSSLQ